MTYPFTMWRWRVYDPIRRRKYESHLMREEEAHALDPKAEKVPGTEMVITGPAGDFSHIGAGPRRQG